MAWLDDAAVAEIGKLLAQQRRADRRQLNHITGFAAGQFLAALLAGEEFATHAPGPRGLPGGYPVRVKGRDITLDLPSGLDEATATAFNKRAGAREGVDFEGDVSDLIAAAHHLIET